MKVTGRRRDKANEVKLYVVLDLMRIHIYTTIHFLKPYPSSSKAFKYLNSTNIIKLRASRCPKLCLIHACFSANWN